MPLPKKGSVFVSVKDSDKASLVEFLKALDNNFDLLATDGTAAFLNNRGISCRRVNKVMEGQPHIVDLIKNGEISYPVSELTIAGNLKDMFSNLTAANDLEFRYGTNAPTIRIEGMTVAGR